MRLRSNAVFVVVSVALLFALGPTMRVVETQGGDRSLGELAPQFFRATAFGQSGKVSSFGPAVPDGSTTSKKSADQKALEIPNRDRFRKIINGLEPEAVQGIAGINSAPMPSPSLSIDGMSSNDNAAAYGFRVLPPDTVGDVGFNHYVQAVNLLVRVFDKSGNALTPPFKMSTLFAPLGTPCSTRNDGDPNVVFDQLADRWIISQFCTQFPPFRQMIAVSKTGDPTGEYFLYEFVMPNVKLNDYPKLGVWPDGYYMSTDQFLGSDYAGSGVFAFDRDKMLQGDPAAGYVYFDLTTPTTIRLGGLLPSDLDGLRTPPNGSPNIFAGYTATEYGDPTDAIRLFNFKPDFADPSNSTFSERAESPIAVTPFDPTSPAGREDIAQPPPGEKLDSQSDRLMYRVAYRNLGNAESIVFNQTVRVTPSDQIYRAGVRVYEFRKQTGAYFAVDSSTIGDATTSRFMGAAAQDGDGNLAVGYSLSNEEKAPSIFYAGRLASEPAGAFRPEIDLVAGSGVQKAFGFRWGDYSGMSVDPRDDCSFWVTNQYYTLASQEESDFGWLTRIGKFRFPECVDASPAEITGVVTNASNGQPIGGATVRVNSVYSRRTGTDGGYADLLVAQPSSLVMIVSAPGYLSETQTFSVNGSGPFVHNFALQPVPVVESSALTITGESCALNNSIEPGENVTVSLTIRNSGAVATTALVGTLRQSGGVVDPGPSQSFQSVPPGGTSGARPFTFRASPGLACGQAIVLTFDFSDGSQTIGSLEVQMPTGTPRIALSENFDSVTAPGLPGGWTTGATGGQLSWTTSVNQSQSSPNSAFSPDPIQPGLNELVSPAFAVNTTGAEVRFRNWYELETTFLRNRLYDGSVLEIKIGAADWQDIEASGGTFLSGGYDGVIDSCCSNPLAGRRGWSGRSGPNQVSEFITSRVRLPATAAGNSVRLRWRVGTDIGTFRTGQFIDDLVVSDGSVCQCSQPPLRAPFDFDGDGRTDLGVFRPSNDSATPDFFVQRSADGSSLNSFWGSVGDVPVNHDFDGDGKTDLAVFRPGIRTWFVLNSSNSSVTIVNFGLESDRLVPSDFDGDGKADIAVFRPSDGNWYIVDSSNGQVRIEKFGIAEDVPVQADYDGDGRSDLAVFRPSTALWYILKSASGNVRIDRFGLSGDKAVAGDFNGDGLGDLCLYRPSDQNWYRLLSNGQFAVTRFGLPDDLPLQADFDGDGVRDIAVFRPSNGVWYYIGSSGSGASLAFGQPGDLAVPSIFVR